MLYPILTAIFTVVFCISITLSPQHSYALESCPRVPGATSSTVVGSLDFISPEGVVEGWAIDLDKPSQRANVDLYINGPIHKGTYATTRITKKTRPDVNQIYGVTGTHGYQWGISGAYRDSKPHCIYAYATTSSGEKILLRGSPRQFILDAEKEPTLPAGYQSISGSIHDTKGVSLSNIAVRVRLDGGVVRDGKTDASGKFEINNFVPVGKTYSVEIAGNSDDPFYAPEGYAGPGKTTQTTQALNTCVKKQQPLHSASYSCQRAGENDCGSSGQCNFVFFPSRVNSCKNVTMNTTILKNGSSITLKAEATEGQPIREMWISFYNKDKPASTAFDRRIKFETDSRFIIRRIFDGTSTVVSTELTPQDFDKPDVNFPDISSTAQKPVNVSGHVYLVNPLGQFSSIEDTCKIEFHIPVRSDRSEENAVLGTATSLPEFPNTVIVGRVVDEDVLQSPWKSPNTPCLHGQYPEAATMNISGYTLSHCDGGGPLFSSGEIDSETKNLELLDLPPGYTCSQWKYTLFNVKKGEWETIASGPGCKMTGVFSPLTETYTNAHHVWFMIRKIVTVATPTIVPYCVRNTWAEDFGFTGESWCPADTKNCDSGWVFLPKAHVACPSGKRLLMQGILCTRWDLAKWFRGSVTCE